MRKAQRGVSLLGLIMGLFLLVILALVGMKLVPSVLEFRAARGAVEAVARESGGPAEIRKAFDRRAQIDDITTISGKDLEITKEGGDVVVSFAYRKEVPLFSNVGVYIDYAASSKGQ